MGRISGGKLCIVHDPFVLLIRGIESNPQGEEVDKLTSNSKESTIETQY